MAVIGDIGAYGCPCGDVKEKGYEIHAHCWRVGNCCPFAGVHYVAKPAYEAKAKKHAKEVAKAIEDGWGCDVKVTSKPRSG